MVLYPNKLPESERVCSGICNTSHPTFRIRHITLVARNQMHVYMENRLPCCLVHINAYIIPIWMIALIYLLFHVLKHHIHSLPLMISQIKIRGHMSLGDNQCMTRRYRITIIKRHTSSRFTNYLYSSRQTAKDYKYTFSSTSSNKA